MNKRYIDEYAEFVYRGEQTPFSLGTLCVVIFCAVLLITATFTKIDISHYWPCYSDGIWLIDIKKYQLVPQIPVVILTSALVGARFGILVLILYLLCGFFLWPVFGFGGGLEYVKSYFFGYILGFFAATLFAGRILSHKYGVKNMFCAAVIGVLSIHICGILYSFILGFFNFSAYTPNFHLVFIQVVYDIVFSMFALVIAKPLKYILWIAMKNAKRSKRLQNENTSEI